NSEALWRSIVSSGVPALSAVLQAFMDARKEGGFLSGVIQGVAEAFAQLKGLTLADQLARVQNQIKKLRDLGPDDREDWEKWMDDLAGAERRNDQEKLNTLLAEEARILKEMSQDAIIAQNRRAIEGRKPNPDYDPARMRELARLEKERWDEA